MEMNTPASNTLCVLIGVLLAEAVGFLYLAYQDFDIFGVFMK